MPCPSASLHWASGCMLVCLGEKTIYLLLKSAAFQMVGVSDDVNEYAMALKDTEEKISRCPKRVSVSGFPALTRFQLSVWQSLSVWQGEVLLPNCISIRPCGLQLRLRSAFYSTDSHSLHRKAADPFPPCQCSPASPKVVYAFALFVQH